MSHYASKSLLYCEQNPRPGGGGARQPEDHGGLPGPVPSHSGDGSGGRSSPENSLVRAPSNIRAVRVTMTTAPTISQAEFSTMESGDTSRRRLMPNLADSRARVASDGS